jgi:hypothetical protein
VTMVPGSLNSPPYWRVRLNVGDMGRCIPIARIRPVKMCPALSFSQTMVDKFTARAVWGIAVDMFSFSPSGGAMSAPCLTDAAPETAPGGQFVVKAAMRRPER